jgi:hypothetical protein
MKTRRIASVVAVAVALTVAVTALADNNFCAALGCQAWSGTITYQGDGSIINYGSGDLDVFCPIDRGSFGSTQKMQAAVFVSSNSPNHVTCAAYTQNAETGAGFGTGSYQNAKADGSRESLPFPAIGHHGSFDVDFLSCALQQDGALYGYRGVEE